MRRPVNNDGDLKFPMLVDQNHQDARRDQPSRLLPAPRRRSLVVVVENENNSLYHRLPSNRNRMVDPQDIRDILQSEYRSSTARIRGRSENPPRPPPPHEVQNINDSSEDSSQEGSNDEPRRSEKASTSISKN
ncbi:unnamed protein product [Cylindrotheca closterium]|uniref:Uncharacterized protein n=1 Tax=Cylindrotheca closterium TaxID=2856 RepID=A0AAD2JMF2_9STRA|nr:unnamed protein product [Cylindrotheca closterium]